MIGELLAPILEASAEVVASGKETFYRQVDLPEADAYRAASRTMCSGVAGEAAREGETLEDVIENTKLELFQDQVFCFTPKGDLIATAGDDKLVKFFQPADGKELRKAAGHTAAVYTVAFSPDGAKLASGSVDKTVRIWNVADAKELAKLSGHPDDVYSLNFSKDGTRLASAGYAGNVLVWDLASSKEKFRIKLPPSTQAYTVAFAPDGKRVAVGASDAKIYLFDIP